VCWVTICWPLTSALSSTRHTNRQLTDSRHLGDIERATAESLRRSVDQCYAASSPVVQPPAIQTHNSCKPSVLRPSCRSRYNRRTVYGMHLRLRTIGLPAWRNRSSIINRLYKTNIDYEKPSLTSLMTSKKQQQKRSKIAVAIVPSAPPGASLGLWYWVPLDHAWSRPEQAHYLPGALLPQTWNSECWS